MACTISRQDDKKHIEVSIDLDEDICSVMVVKNRADLELLGKTILGYLKHTREFQIQQELGQLYPPEMIYPDVDFS